MDRVEFSIRHLIWGILIVLFIAVCIIAYVTLKERGEDPIEDIWEPLIDTIFQKTEFFGLYFNGKEKEFQSYSQGKWEKVNINIQDGKLKEFFQDLNNNLLEMVSRAENQEINIGVKSKTYFEGSSLYANFGKAIICRIDLEEDKFYCPVKDADLEEELRGIKNSVNKENIVIEDRNCRLYWGKSKLYFEAKECFDDEWQSENFRWQEERFGVDGDYKFYFYKGVWEEIPLDSIGGAENINFWKRGIFSRLKERMKEVEKAEISLGNLKGATKFDSSGNLEFSAVFMGKDLRYRLSPDLKFQVHVNDWKYESYVEWEEELRDEMIKVRAEAEKEYNDRGFDFAGENKPFFEVDEQGKLRLVVRVRKNIGL